VRIECNIFIF